VEFLQPILERAARQPQQARRTRDVALGFVERLQDQRALQRFEIQPALGDLDVQRAAARRRRDARAHRGRQVGGQDLFALGQQQRALDGRFQLAHVTGQS
jgi:hypothetical protein